MVHPHDEFLSVLNAGSQDIFRRLVERYLDTGLPVGSRDLSKLLQTELSPAEVRYCRSVTWLWVLFFALNGSIAAFLALRGPISLWAAYTGVISYVLIGAVFALEFLVRRLRFGRFGDGPHDRLLKHIWPRSLLNEREGGD